MLSSGSLGLAGSFSARPDISWYPSTPGSPPRSPRRRPLPAGDRGHQAPVVDVLPVEVEREDGKASTVREHMADGADRKSTRLNSSHSCTTRMPSSAWKKQP